MPTQPNILMIIADQMAARALPAYGNRVAKTPAINRLAEEGVVFNSAYCNSPLCGPSRFSLMSGRLPSKIGAYDNAAEFRSDVPTFGHYLRAAKYRTILAGKMHFVGADQLHGFEERLTTDIYPADFGWVPDWTQPDHRPEWYHSMESVTTAGPCSRSNQIDFDEEVVFMAKRRLFDLARDDTKQPFCMVVSLSHPHDPFTISREYWDRYTDSEIDSPRIPEMPLPADPHSLRLRHVCGIDAEPVTQEQIQASRHAYYGAISFVDDQVMTLRKTLEETGFADDTIIIFMSDHGEMLGERGLWYKMSFFEDACRVPLIVHAPKRYQPHHVMKTVSLVDLLPTFAALAAEGGEPQFMTPIEGHSLIPHLEGTTGHDAALGEYLSEGAIAPIVMIRHGNYKFIHTASDPDQLYDLASDPDELCNLAESANHRATIASFRKEVEDRWALEQLNAEILVSQSKRRFINEALKQGQLAFWDYEPPKNASQLYIRSHMELEALEARARFPRVGTKQTES